MNNGVNNNNVNQNNSADHSTEEIKAAKVYKLAPENAPKEIPKTEEPVWVKKERERENGQVVTPNVAVAPQPQVVKVKSKNILSRILFIIIILMGAYIGFNYYTNRITLIRLNNMNSPVSTLGDTKKLSLDSTIVLDLYSKVKTNIREDVAESSLNDSMKLYLAYRSIPKTKFYESNCNGFDNAAMLPFTCSAADTLNRPDAFKLETLRVEYKKLFGEDAPFTPGNIQIGKNCIGGYQYIDSRKEFVEGSCTENITTTYKVSKELISATSTESTIVLKEKVKYSASEGQELPDYLKSGMHIYTFKLDKNYNYVYVNKYIEEEE